MRVFYLRDKQKNKKGELVPGKPVVAVASEFQGDSIAFSVATWNPKDKYQKAILYNKAIGRLRGKQIEGKVSSERGIKERILRFIADSPGASVLSNKLDEINHRVAKLAENDTGTKQKVQHYGSYIGHLTKMYASQWLADMSEQKIAEIKQQQDDQYTT